MAKTGEKETRVKQISTLKLTMIHALIGEDTKVLTTDDELRSFFIDKFREQIRLNEEKASWDAKYHNLLSILRTNNPQLLEKAMSIPHRVRIARKTNTNKKGVIVILNPAPAQPLSDAILKKIDILTPNETEAEILCGGMKFGA